MKTKTRSTLAWIVAGLAVAWMLITAFIVLAGNGFSEGWLLASSVWYVMVFVLALLLLFGPIEEQTVGSSVVVPMRRPEREVLLDLGRASVEAHSSAGSSVPEILVIQDGETTHLDSVEQALDAIEAVPEALASPLATEESRIEGRPARTPAASRGATA